MSLTAVPFQSYIEKVSEKIIDWDNDTFYLALVDTEPTAATDTVWSDVSGDEISAGNGYTAGGEEVTIGNSSQSGGTFTATASGNIVWTATATWDPFRYVVLWDDTAADDPVCCYWDYGENITLNNGDTFTFNTNVIVLVTKAPA